MKLLLVEDNDDHAYLTKRCLEEAGINQIERVNNGEQAIDFLKKQGAFTEVYRPDLIILDLKMPRLDGLEVLEIIKQDDTIKCIPVVMLTTSNASSDRKKAYARNVNSYVVKPVALDELQKVITQIITYWQGIDIGLTD